MSQLNDYENLNEYEKDILKSYEKGEWKSIDNSKEEMEKYRNYAAQSLKKDKRINIRLSSKDLEDIQKRAIAEGIPYQTLIAGIIHKYNTGRLIERQEPAQAG
jgi:predicted DNA binding CopG/RHH family protein